MTAQRLPCWTCPRFFGRTIAWTSPLTTQLLHHCCHLARLGHILGVFHQPPSLGRQPRAFALSFRGLRDCAAGGLGPGDASASRDFIEGTDSVVAEAERKWVGRCHGKSVAHFALRLLCSPQWRAIPIVPRVSPLCSASSSSSAILRSPSRRAGSSAASGSIRRRIRLRTCR